MKNGRVRTLQHGLAMFAACALLAGPATAAPTPSRTLEQPRGLGGAIAPGFSVKPDVLRPFEPSVVMACVTNQNPRSRRSIETGDELRFELTESATASCAGVSVVPSDSALDADTFACEVDDGTIILRSMGESMRWPAGDAVCATLSLTPGGESLVVRSSVRVANEGAWSPVSPAAVLVNVAPDLGIPGPTGPEGPIGPQGPVGPPGAGGIGARAFSFSNDFVDVAEGEPPAVIPGLDLTVPVGGGSRLLIFLDATQWDCRPPSSAEGIVHLEVDGELVAARHLYWSNDNTWSATIAWLSDPLAAGTIAVRGLAEADGSHLPGTNVQCIGGMLHEEHFGTSRLTVLEVLP